MAKFLIFQINLGKISLQEVLNSNNISESVKTAVKNAFEG